jgi:hypothetical protein
VQLFHHINTGGFLRLPMDWGECNTSRLAIRNRASPAKIENRGRETFSPVRKGKDESRFQLIRERWEDTGEWKLKIGDGWCQHHLSSRETEDWKAFRVGY